MTNIADGTESTIHDVADQVDGQVVGAGAIETRPETGASSGDIGPSDRTPDNGVEINLPEITQKRNWRQNPYVIVVAATGTVTSVCMFIALFLPWAKASIGNQSLSDYTAPQTAIVSWVLLALGLATVMVTVGAFAFGSRGSVLAMGTGGLLYALGAMIWYASTVLPNMVASGCTNNGGSLCQAVATNTLVPGIHVAPGFVLGFASSLVLVTVCLLFRNIKAEPDDARL